MNPLPLLFFVIATSAVIQPFANDSPHGAYFAAKFDGTGVIGEVSFKGMKDGSIEINVDLEGFPRIGGPFMYHVHEAPVPTDGNCTGAKAHFNPFGGNLSATNPEELEIGDLNGRYGLLQGDSCLAYIDHYLSLNSQSKAFIGGLSVVVHLDDNTRIACANITQCS